MRLPAVVSILGVLALLPPPELSADPTDPENLEAFVDGLMSAHRADFDIAGATVAVVRDGELLFSKGYGWADVEERRPVDPATTLFRIGSVTKLFTWTAVMQLEEAGELDLDTDVNEYLDFRIPESYGEPITLRHLLTHTPGFEDRVYGLFGRDPDVTRGEWLQDNLPARVRPAGRYTSYSNYGTALAGYIVERVSGMDWASYLEQRILEPLGMEYATGREPLPEALEPHMSRGYSREDGRFRDRPFEWIDAGAPGGSMSASAEAMAPFMIAHLEGGAVDGARILEESTTRRMQERAFASDPRVNGMALGFYERSSHGLRIVGHTGGTQWFFTDLVLIPEEELGIFVSYNSDGAAPLLMGGLVEAILDRYHPAERWTPPTPEPGWEHRAREYAGTYAFLRASQTTFEKLLGALMGRVRVEVGDEEGDIILRVGAIDAQADTDRLREVEPGYFRSVSGHREVAFEGSAQEGYSHLFLSDMAPTAAERVAYRAQGGVHLALLLFALLLFLSLPFVMMGRWLLARRFEDVEPARGLERSLRWLGMGFLAVALLCFLLLSGGIADQEAFLSGEGESLVRMALFSSLLLVLVGAAVVAGAVAAARRRLWSPAGRVHFALFALAVLVFIAQLHYWNLLGPNV